MIILNENNAPLLHIDECLPITCRHPSLITWQRAADGGGVLCWYSFIIIDHKVEQRTEENQILC